MCFSLLKTESLALRAEEPAENKMVAHKKYALSSVKYACDFNSKGNCKKNH